MFCCLFLLQALIPALFLRGFQQCDEATLNYVGRMLSVNVCILYNESQLGRVNSFLLAPHANITMQNFDFTSGTCGDYFSMPLNIYFPLVFRVVHTCLAAIPVYSHRGTDGRVSVTGYGDLVVATQSKIKEITFIYTQPLNDCTLLLESMVMRDVQCIGAGGPTTSTATTTTTTTGTGPTSSSTTRITGITTSIGKITSSPYYDDDRYTRIDVPPRDAQDSFNNPIFHQDLPVCPVRYGRFRMVMVKSNHKHAALVCLRKGLRLASLRRNDLGAAIGMVTSCLGPNQSAWIGQYWRTGGRPNQCLELSSGASPRSGGIALASSCSKLQAVLCEDAYFEVSS